MSGHIVIETPGIDLWIEVDEVTVLKGDGEQEHQDLMPVIKKFPRPRLVRWEFITNASVFPEKPDDKELMGFKLR